MASLAAVLNGEGFTKPHILLGWEVGFPGSPILLPDHYSENKEEMKPAGPATPYHVTPSCHSHDDFFF